MFHLSLQKDRNIPTLYKKVHDFWDTLYIVNTLKVFLSGTKRPMTLKLRMHHWFSEYYQVCSNDDPGFTLTYFAAKSNLVPFALIWENGKTMIFFRNYCSL